MYATIRPHGVTYKLEKSPPVLSHEGYISAFTNTFSNQLIHFIGITTTIINRDRNQRLVFSSYFYYCYQEFVGIMVTSVWWEYCSVEGFVEQLSLKSS